MKHWNEALLAQHLGSKLDKEKPKTMKAQELQTTGIFKNTEGEEKKCKKCFHGNLYFRNFPETLQRR
ncbi:hypothetical protein ACQP3D_28470, partial [Escherichia coli]